MAGQSWRVASTFGSLRNRPFLWLWLGRLASSATFEMGGVVQGWLVYQLTGSAFLLGWVSAGWSLATLVLAPYGGVICDRLPKRTVLLWTRAGMALNSLILGLLVVTGAIQVWQLALSSLFTGVLFAFMLPAQQAIISDLVDRSTLLNAFSLDALGMGLMGVVGASASGWLIQLVGPAAVYFAMLGFFLLAVFTITKLPDVVSSHLSRGSIWVDMKEGLRYLGASPLLLGIMGLSLARVLFGMPYRTLMPAFARQNLGFEAAGLGLLMGAPGLGALLAALLLASLGDWRGKGRLLTAAGVAMGFGLILFVTVPWLPLTFLCLALVGATGNICMVLTNTMVQTHCQPDCRGRVLSLYVMLWGLTPLGTLPAGAIADHTGVPPVVIGQGILIIVVFAAFALLLPQLRRME